jgi:hypothetical protein
MGSDYFNTNWITDVHCKDIATRQTITQTLTNLDEEIEQICQLKGVPVDSIPVDGSGYISSVQLKEFARMWIYVSLLGDYWGVAHGENDIYYKKMLKYEGRLTAAEADLTSDNILANTPLDSSSFIQQAVIY